MATESSLIGNAGFSASSTDFRIVHPLSASPATSAFFPPPPPPPPSSCSPPASQQMTSNTSSNGSTNAEDVTTIFVVGFPDDMLEREFQNMFTFSPGFEAASLKWHCKDQDDDATGSNSNGSGGAAAKKQMIGFARFRTRLEAMEAVEVLSGKKIDAEKGAVLKAEMAKKNLHIKRGSIVPGSAAHSGGSATAIAAAAAAAVAAAHQQHPHPHHPATAAAAAAAVVAPEPSPLSVLSRKMSLHHGAAAAPPPPPPVPPAPHSVYDSFSPLPSDLLSPADYKSDPFNDHPLVSTPTTPAFNDAYFSLRSQSFDTRSNDMVVSPRAFSLYSRPRVGSIHPLMQQQLPQQQQQQQQQQHDMVDSDPFGYLSKSSPADRANSISTSYFDSHTTTTDSILGSRMGSLSLHNDVRTPSLSSPSYRPNPADQNPPCNTLYVGNLPPSTSEDELRQLFSKRANFKRLLFRNKNQQGPMCFVEFEDVTYATQAMNELQGYNLSNSVKGGIRLSFSKNPLFTKPNKQQTKAGGSDIDSPM